MGGLRGKGTDRVLDILDFLAAKGVPCSVPEISTGTRSPRSTTYLLVEQLEDRGYLEKYDGSRYLLGRTVAMLGNVATRHLDFARFIRTSVQQLAADAGQLAELVALDQWKQIVLVAAVARPSYMLSAEGTRHPLPRTASARFLLRDFSHDDIRKGVGTQDYVLRDGSTMTPEAFIDSIEAVRGADAFALRGQVDPHLACIASPIFNRTGQCVAAVSLVIPLVEFDGKFDLYAGHTRAAAKTITEHLLPSSVTRDGMLGLLLQKPHD